MNRIDRFTDGLNVLLTAVACVVGKAWNSSLNFFSAIAGCKLPTKEQAWEAYEYTLTAILTAVQCTIVAVYELVADFVKKFNGTIDEFQADCLHTKHVSDNRLENLTLKECRVKTKGTGAMVTGSAVVVVLFVAGLLCTSGPRGLSEDEYINERFRQFDAQIDADRNARLNETPAEMFRRLER